MAGETLPEGWKRTTLGAVADFVNGDRGENYPSQSDRVGAGVPFINTGHIEPNGRLTRAGMNYITRGAFERLRSGKVKPGDIVYCLRGSTIGKTARNHFVEGAIASSLVIVRAKGDACQEFLYFYLTSPFGKQLVAQHDNGSAQPNLSVRALSNYPLNLPAVGEQRAIAHILGTLDDKIELNRQMSETLEAMARALFKSWFVDFDPVRSKAAGRDPGLPKPLADPFPASLVDSVLGEVPEGWEVGCFGDVVEQLRNNENPISFPEVTFSHFSIPAFDDGQWPKQECGENIKSQKSRVPPGVVLMSKLNPEIERVWFVDVQPEDRAVCSTELLVLQPRQPYGRSYAYCLARSPVFRQEIESLVTGTSKSHQRAQVGAILGMTVVKPADLLVQHFERVAEPLLNRTLACRRESRSLAALRDTLLPRLLTGELPIKEMISLDLRAPM